MEHGPESSSSAGQTTPSEPRINKGVALDPPTGFSGWKRGLGFVPPTGFSVLAINHTLIYTLSTLMNEGGTHEV